MADSARFPTFEKMGPTVELNMDHAFTPLPGLSLLVSVLLDTIDDGGGV